MTFLIHSKTSTVKPVKLENGEVNPFTLHWVGDYLFTLELKLVHFVKDSLFVNTIKTNELKPTSSQKGSNKRIRFDQMKSSVAQA